MLGDIALRGVTINGKYVNIADIMADFSITTASKLRPVAAPQPAPAPGQPCWDLIELFFFAYRDFVGDPDVNRNPGMKVAELLDVLKITKQSLGRVLKQLIDEGYIVQKEGANDRRQRLLYVSDAGEALAMRLAGMQTARIGRVLAELGPGARDQVQRFLAGMIDAEDRDQVLRLIARADGAHRRDGVS